MSSSNLSDKKFTFTHKPAPSLTIWKRSLLWLLRIPAYDILFLAATSLLGISALWVINFLANPAYRADQAVPIILDGSNKNFSGILFLVIMTVLAVIFWIGAAYATHRCILWVARRTQIIKLLPLKICLLCISWLPLLAIVSQNFTYSGQLLLVGAMAIFISSMLFVIESLLLSYWSLRS